MSTYTTDVHAERVGHLGLITLNRPKALNALSLAMVRELNHVLQQWQDDVQVRAVVVRGSNKEGPFGAFCAGVVGHAFEGMVDQPRIGRPAAHHGAVGFLQAIAAFKDLA